MKAIIANCNLVLPEHPVSKTSIANPIIRDLDTKAVCFECWKVSLHNWMVDTMEQPAAVEAIGPAIRAYLAKEAESSNPHGLGSSYIVQDFDDAAEKIVAWLLESGLARR